MASATAGKAGNLKIGANVVGGIRKFQLKADNQSEDCTVFGDTVVKRILGLGDSSISSEGNHDMTDAQQAAIKDAILGQTKLSNVKGCTTAASGYTVASMVPKSMTIDAEVGAKPVGISVDLEGDGAVTYGAI